MIYFRYMPIGLRFEYSFLEYKLSMRFNNIYLYKSTNRIYFSLCFIVPLVLFFLLQIIQVIYKI